MQKLFIWLTVIGALLLSVQHAAAQDGWKVDARAAAGPIAQVDLPSSGGKRRGALIAFEIARRCDPIFSFAEISGSTLGRTISQSVLNGSKIGLVVNGDFYTWHAAITKYDNGYEAGFGITNELFLQLLVNLNSMAYITPSGETVPLPTTGFRQSVQSAIDACRARIR